MSESKSLARRVALRAALVVVPPLLLLGLSELVLAALGLGGGASHSLGRGFDDQAAYLVPDPEQPGGWVTQIFGDPSFEVHVPPRDERVRVLLFGGSNTQLLPQWRLGETADALADDGRRYEVVNLGRMGYGSARVRILLHQAMSVLRPDVVVIYSGHNEFVERGFATEVEASGGLLRAAADVFSNLRTFRLFEQELRPTQPPPDIDPAQAAFADFTWADAQPVFAAYRDNIEAMCRLSLEAGARVVLCTVVGNDWCPPQVSDSGLPAAEAAEVEQVLRQIVKTFPARFSLFPGGAVTRLRVGFWFSGRIPVEFPDPVLRPLSGFLAHSPELVRGDVRSDSVEGCLWPATTTWNAQVRGLMTLLEANVADEPTDAERAALQQIAEALDDVLAKAPHHARALFLAGQVSTLLGDASRGARQLVDAATYDCAPRRGNPTTNGLVREVAESLPEVVFYDAASEFAAACPDGTVGYEVMMDGCHLQPGARVALLDELAAIVVSLR
ncbi:MAG: SGNH/GDSL hydrolase family protein [Planctomycetes bacterium]|nr:SGNH/GDSL hydrolase family protein [Planctomycetota bacterium]